MLSVQCTLSSELGGLAGSVFYIDTESTFSAERLVEIAEAKHPDLLVGDKLVELTSRVIVDTHQTCASLMNRLNTIEKEIIKKNVKLVIVDSIASLVRKEYSTSMVSNITDRNNFLTQQAALLKYIAETFSIPVVVTNQITTRFQSQGVGAGPGKASDVIQMDGESSYVTAALGNTWSHSVNTRLILQYHTDNERQVMVAKSPVAPFTVFTYTIQKAGLVQKGGAGHYSGTDPGKQNIQVKSALRIDTFTRAMGPDQG
ncbi:DNA repair protein RAD51 homolog 2-like isoform X2 [Argopecten irradians]|uniref:DNA repair protein RAD51 homolog 2-like isoform X2 n=1 Tax=Argopecten irradians TaxID=31199 RepID=UPI00371FE155